MTGKTKVVLCACFNIDENISTNVSEHFNEKTITPRNDLWKPLRGEKSIVNVFLFVWFHCSF